MFKEIKENVYWVGKVDWAIRKFHGDEYSTHRGTSYNSYLIRDRKAALIDTVWNSFASEFVSDLEKEGVRETVDFIVANHAEPDHSGALPELMRHLPNIPIYCSANGVRSLKGYYHKDWNFVAVKTGDTLDLGKRRLIFVEAPLLHWPDSMFCYLTGENILFSNDAFGQHLASERLFNDLVDQAELDQEAIKYFANILVPFSPLVEKKIEEFKELNLPLDMICPSHGVIWRERPLQIVEKYLDWARNYSQDQITIIYDSMWDGTRRMAEAIASGITSADDRVVVKLFNISRSDKNDVVTEVFKSRVILVGSPTINRGILSAVAGFLEQIRGLKFRTKQAATFGAYGWSGEAVKMINEELEKAGFELLGPGLKCLWNPDGRSLSECVEFGKNIAIKSSALRRTKKNSDDSGS